ncbi:P2Y purinoceptor 13-like [Polymixia lowei]
MPPALIMDCGFNKDSIDVAVSILGFLLFIPAVILNGIALWIALHLPSKSTFMVYLKNLVAADLLMTLTLPLEAINGLPSPPVVLEAISCQYSAVIFYYCMYMSIILLGLISLDRFFKIVRPFSRLMGQNLTFAKVVSASIWGIYLSSVVIPTMVFTNEKPKSTKKGFCMDMKSNKGLILHKGVTLANTVIFWVVCIIISFSYACIAMKVYQSYRNSGSNNDEGRRKTNARVFVVLVVFLLCFAPYHVIRTTYTQLQLTPEENCKKDTFYIAKRITLWLSATNVFLDPLIYFFLCRAFREKLYELVPLESISSSQTHL